MNKTLNKMSYKLTLGNELYVKSMELQRNTAKILVAGFEGGTLKLGSEIDKAKMNQQVANMKDTVDSANLKLKKAADKSFRAGSFGDKEVMKQARAISGEKKSAPSGTVSTPGGPTTSFKGGFNINVTLSPNAELKANFASLNKIIKTSNTGTE